MRCTKSMDTLELFCGQYAVASSHALRLCLK